ncbi:SPOR domain-containing protein [Edaphobacter albus]|uniref:SPOR domain-containing protein n=1 Tax=Edaphobacter sp. 4G125 TaxID=2763071 RepID=UPI001648AE41|nr:SPOR domain-containing protein [Edaphobacter sp. 4G125]QNI37604.1 SPOR domain-containing protein [Edaphobacter sp. 4G125]
MTVKTRYIEDDDIDTSSEREISLSPSTVLGIFFLLAIICAVFFGFGYSMGHRSATASIAAANASGDDTQLKATGNSKPSPSLSNQNLTPADAAAAAASDNSDSSQVASSAPVSAPVEETPAPTKPQPHLQRVVAKSTPAPPPAAPAVSPKTTPAPHPVAAAGPPALVQIAAVSHQEDADMLVSALKRKGYAVAVRREPQDKLFHIQLGPFPTRKDADAMRQRLAGDGYNAIVK